MMKISFIIITEPSVLCCKFLTKSARPALGHVHHQSHHHHHHLMKTRLLMMMMTTMTLPTWTDFTHYFRISPQPPFHRTMVDYPALATRPFVPLHNLVAAFLEMAGSVFGDSSSLNVEENNLGDVAPPQKTGKCGNFSQVPPPLPPV